MDTKDAITLILATIGTVLGIINYWRSIRDEKVRLRVVPVLAWNFGEVIMIIRSSMKIGELIDRYGIPRMGVEVINLSKFPITLDEVGLCEGNIEKRERAKSKIMQNQSNANLKTKYIKYNREINGQFSFGIYSLSFLMQKLRNSFQNLERYCIINIPINTLFQFQKRI